jgi:hypothetical protein
MIVLPLATEPAPATPAAAHADTQATTIKLLALGFSSSERKLIQGVVALTHRRHVRLDLLEADAWTTADVLLLDGSDAKVVAWAADQPSLSRMPVIWVGGNQPAAPKHLQIKQPVQWPTLPALLQRALGLDVSDSARQALAAH